MNDNNTKKKSGLTVYEIMMGVIGLAVLVFVVIPLIDTDDSFFSSAKTQKTQEYSIQYRITCKECSVTYTTSSGMEQKSQVNSGWTYSYKARRYESPYISAQNMKEHGTITVAIWVNGTMVKHSKSEGEYVIATADYFIE